MSTPRPEQRAGPRRHADRNLRLAIYAVTSWALVGTVGIVVLVLALGHADAVNTRATQAFRRTQLALMVQHRQILESCQRLNVQRALLNANGSASFSFFGEMLRTLQRHPGIPFARASRHGFLAAARNVIARDQWAPLTDCRRAVAQDGPAYRLPAPVKFTVRLPSASQSSIANAERLAPAGSAR